MRGAPAPCKEWPDFSRVSWRPTQSCNTNSDIICKDHVVESKGLPMSQDKVSPPGSSVHGILQARLLEWEAISFSRGSSQPRDQIQVSCISRQILYHSTTREAPHLWVWKHNLRRMIGKIAQFVTASYFSNSFFHLCTHTQRVDPSHFRYMVCIFVWSLWFKRSMMYSSLWFWTYILWVFCTAVT